MLNRCEFVGVNVECDARTRMSHLPRHRDHVSSLSDQMRTECVPQVVGAIFLAMVIAVVALIVWLVGGFVSAAHPSTGLLSSSIQEPAC